MTATAVRSAAEPITLRVNFGSLRVVDEVLAFDAGRKVAFVRFIDEYGIADLDSVSLSELEALDANRRYVDVEQVVRSMTNEINE